MIAALTDHVQILREDMHHPVQQSDAMSSGDEDP